MKEALIGPVRPDSELPLEVSLDGRDYYLLKGAAGARLLVSRRCPHAGQAVEFEDGELACPMHGWAFDPANGACLNVPGKGLAAYPVEERSGQWLALFPEDGALG
ncbi:Rieske (2Fe-2S) protein [Paenibacillus athensensis]|uniref:Rieske domain-containing protein n=1 Tax=Paenibacillus athensensis TaxID=1967502 RepID=A0A4Y8Q9X3_9BACL|nr:Rieske (2Fe-2S) protein [Paenibacillus athensensis]MCD1258933.1 Rieske (2Fe-2S) protein [Paenibacillus athensensis]